VEVEAEVERDNVVAVLARIAEQRSEADDRAGEPVELRGDDPTG
jgi:hypothetical protein